MATNLKRVGGGLKYQIVTGNGEPTNGDALIEKIRKYDQTIIYIDEDTGKIYTSTALNGVVADFVTSTGGDSGSQTLQDVLDEQGATALDKDNTIDGGQNALWFDNLKLVDFVARFPNNEASNVEFLADAASENFPFAYIYMQNDSGGSSELELTLGGATLKKDNAAFVATEDSHIATKKYVDDNATVGYKVYTALLNQSGSSAPVATPLGDNTIGAIVWTRESEGRYVATLSAAFPFGKTRLPPLGTLNYGGDNGESYFVRTDNNSLLLITRDTGVASDDILSDTSIEIQVYP